MSEWKWGRLIVNLASGERDEQNVSDNVTNIPRRIYKWSGACWWLMHTIEMQRNNVNFEYKCHLKIKTTWAGENLIAHTLGYL